MNHPMAPGLLVLSMFMCGVPAGRTQGVDLLGMGTGAAAPGTAAAAGPVDPIPAGRGRTDWSQIFPPAAGSEEADPAGGASPGLAEVVQRYAYFHGLAEVEGPGPARAAAEVAGTPSRLELQARRARGETLTRDVHAAMVGWSSVAERRAEIMAQGSPAGWPTRGDLAEEAALRVWMAQFDADISALRARGARLTTGRDEATRLRERIRTLQAGGDPAPGLAAVVPRWVRELEADLRADAVLRAPGLP